MRHGILQDIRPGLYGRAKLVSSVDEVDESNVVDVLNDALRVHDINLLYIDYLMWYMRGCQPIENRVKTVRPEINNKVVENRAYEIVHFLSSYFLGEPCTYIRRGANDEASKTVEMLNNYMFAEDKASCDKALASDVFCCGQGYRMVLPDKDAGNDEDESPFELDTLDPRYTFVVYNNGFGKRRLMGVTYKLNKNDEIVYEVYTPNMFFKIISGVIVHSEPHSLGDIPIFEYINNEERMGAFEPVITILDVLNGISSNRADSIEQFVSAFLKFINCDIDEGDLEKFRALGAIKIKSNDGLNADVDLVTSELNQNQTQTLVDYYEDLIAKICGMPTSTKGLGGGTSGNVGSVIMHAGWQQCEARMKDTELLFKKSEKQFLKLVARMVKDARGIEINMSEIELKFVRRQYEDMITKTQSLQNMLQSGIAPEVAIAECGKFNDPQDVFARSEEFLRKWEYKEMSEGLDNVNSESSDEDDKPKGGDGQSESTDMVDTAKSA